jgi:hypothetical protein
MKKGPGHIDDLVKGTGINISINRTDPKEWAPVYKQLIETILSKNSIVKIDGTLNFQEQEKLFIDYYSQIVVAFDWNTRYEKSYFVSSYKKEAQALKETETTKNLGISKEQWKFDQLSNDKKMQKIEQQLLKQQRKELHNSLQPT